MKTLFRLTLVFLFLGLLRLSAATLYVSPASITPTSPYNSWLTAATNIPDAVNAATAGDTVLVTNGVYAGGLAVNKPLTLLSVNGPQVTTIDGASVNQCISMSDGVSLSGFTLTNGFAQNGGGILKCTD